ncbi:MAG: hypothetical protein AAF573_06525, partial [Bacteroidota bacterium]
FFLMIFSLSVVFIYDFQKLKTDFQKKAFEKTRRRALVISVTSLIWLALTLYTIQEISKLCPY